MGDDPYFKVGEVGTQSVQSRAPSTQLLKVQGRGPGAVSLRPRRGQEEADLSSAD